MTEQEFRNRFSGGHLGDKLDFKQRLNVIADFLFPKIEEIDDDKTLSVEDNGKVFGIGTDAKTVTLPATEDGLEFTFINTGADGAVKITLSPNADDAIYGTVQNAAADSVASGTDDKDLINVKNTANNGDWVKLRADGDGGWYILGGVGIWTSEDDI